MFRPLTIASTVAVLTLIGGVALADRHHDGHGKVKGTQNGAVHLGTTKHGHAPHAVMKNGKVSALAVHKNGQDVTRQVTTKKFKTKNRKHLTEAGAYVEEGTDLNAIWWVGYAFFCPFDNYWHIFWFPVEICEGGTDDAEEI